MWDCVSVFYTIVSHQSNGTARSDEGLHAGIATTMLHLLDRETIASQETNFILIESKKRYHSLGMKDTDGPTVECCWDLLCTEWFATLVVVSCNSIQLLSSLEGRAGFTCWTGHGHHTVQYRLCSSYSPGFQLILD